MLVGVIENEDGELSTVNFTKLEWKSSGFPMKWDGGREFPVTEYLVAAGKDSTERP